MHSPRFFNAHTAGCLGLLLVLIVHAAALAEQPDYLMMRELLANLKSMPELFANEEDGRVAFCTVKQIVVTDDNANATPALAKSEKEATAQWVEAFAQQQALFEGADVQSLLRQIKSGDDLSAQSWYRNIVGVRLLANSPEWQVTNTWLAQFWSVQAMYEEAEVATFQKTLRQLTPDGIRFVMEHLITLLGKRVQGRKAAAMRRPTYQFSRPTAAQTSPTSGTVGSYRPATNSPVRTARQRPNDGLSRRVSNYYIYRGSLFYGFSY